MILKSFVYGVKMSRKQQKSCLELCVSRPEGNLSIVFLSLPLPVVENTLHPRTNIPSHKLNQEHIRDHG